MWNNRRPTHGQTRSNALRRWLALCVLGGLLLPTLGAAQALPGPQVVVLKSGLHSIYGGHFFLLTVAEVGSLTSTSAVTIEFRDAADQQRAFASATLQRVRPVRVRVPIPAGVGRDQLRAIVKIRPLTNLAGSEPIVSLEDVDADSFKVEPKIFCPVHIDQDPSSGSGVEGNCDGWRVFHLTLEQANSLD